MIEKIYPNSKISDSHKLENFYKSVERRAQDIISPKAKTTLINELYERFFKNAFMSVWRVILSIIFPPLAVYDRGCGSILIVLILTIAGWVPGVIAALVILNKEEGAK